jgi:hypothetical protein
MAIRTALLIILAALRRIHHRLAARGVAWRLGHG